MIIGLNHVTFAVRDINRSIAFYRDLLGFTVRKVKPSAAYLESGTLWLALVVDPTVRKGPLPEYSHTAFTIPPADLVRLTGKLTTAGVAQWQQSERPDSFYFLDPDGHKLELHSGNLESRCR